MAITAPPPPVQRAVPAPAERPSLPQYSRTKIIGVWAAAALPMGLLSWVGAPLLADHIDGPAALPKALLLLLTAGLIWQCALVAILLAPERRSPDWPGLREALWLRAPKPRRGWLLLPLLILAFGAEEMVPQIHHAVQRDLGPFFESHAGHAMMAGSWSWFALIGVMVIFNTVLGEELLFRGLLLPRMNRAFGRGDWLVNGVLFALYHLHTPWVMPATLADSFILAYPAKRFRSAWLPIVVHSVQSVVVTGVALSLVLR
jgi:membrane protease YdiL (CAAX protease family)